MSGEQLTRDERREEYYRLLSIVDAQTSKAQPAMASKTSITTIASRIGLEWEKRLKAAVENEDLLAYDGRVCLADREAILDRLPTRTTPTSSGQWSSLRPGRPTRGRSSSATSTRGSRR